MYLCLGRRSVGDLYSTSLAAYVIFLPEPNWFRLPYIYYARTTVVWVLIENNSKSVANLLFIDL